MAILGRVHEYTNELLKPNLELGKATKETPTLKLGLTPVMTVNQI